MHGPCFYMPRLARIGRLDLLDHMLLQVLEMYFLIGRSASGIGGADWGRTVAAHGQQAEEREDGRMRTWRVGTFSMGFFNGVCRYYATYKKKSRSFFMT
jgi:hypothetical protein